MNNLNRILSRNLKAPTGKIIRLKSTQSSAEYCIESVKKYDYENFLCTLLLKGTSRSVALAVRSFNVEVARVTERVSQESIGLMRLKFWEDMIDKCYTKDLKQVPKHPVAIELYKALSQTNLSKRYFRNLVSARQNYITSQGMTSLEELETYCEQTVSSTYYLMLEGCGVKDLKADHAASHLGKAQGITHQLRSIPHSKKFNYIPIPQDILVKHGLSQENVLRGTDPQKISDCVYEIASQAYHHLQKAKNLQDQVPERGKMVLLPAVATLSYLDRLQKVNYNVLDSSLQARSWKLLPTLYLSMLRNKY